MPDHVEASVTSAGVIVNMTLSTLCQKDMNSLCPGRNCSMPCWVARARLPRGRIGAVATTCRKSQAVDVGEQIVAVWLMPDFGSADLASPVGPQYVPIECRVGRGWSVPIPGACPGALAKDSGMHALGHLRATANG